MKRSVFCLIATVCCMAARADVPQRKMLEEGKMWVYVYHHFEETETPGPNGDYYDHSIWMSYYQLEGDTIIDGRQYMKMYRSDDRNYKKRYYGAFREDEEGRVYMYGYLGDEQDHLVLDFSMRYDSDLFDNVTPIVESVKVDGQLFRRYRYQNATPDGQTWDMGVVGVEGVGFQRHGLIYDPFAPEPDCICDYESLAEVWAKNFSFPDAAFQVPKVVELSDGERQLVASNNDFAFNLFRQVRGESSSVLSPLSVTYALGMMNNGASGQTQQEINQTLGFGEAGADGINAFCKKMLDEAGTLDEKTKALISNTVFVNEGMGCRLQDGFMEKANEFYAAQPQNRDFNDGQTMDVINQWANDHTEGMIPRVFDEESFNPWAVSYLLNAIYFKGVWSTPFDVSKTKEESFGGGSAVPMMHQMYTEYSYTSNDLYQAIVLPYGNGAYRMSIFLPREDKTIGDVLDTLTGKNWEVRGSLYEVDLKLPRFETDVNINLVKAMSDLGMPTAFTGYAEFPYFCNMDAFIGNMFQVAKIKLDERGTEAAAVTVINAATGIPRTAVFHATRPFLYIISEQSTGTIFFIGQYTGKNTAGDTDGIGEMKNEVLGAKNVSDDVYDLSGRRIAEPSMLPRGVYIKGGKVMVK